MPLIGRVSLIGAVVVALCVVWWHPAMGAAADPKVPPPAAASADPSKAVEEKTGSTPFPRTGELRVSLPAAETLIAVAVGDYASVRCNQRYRLSLRPSSGTVVDLPAPV